MFTIKRRCEQFEFLGLTKPALYMLLDKGTDFGYPTKNMLAITEALVIGVDISSIPPGPGTMSCQYT